MMPTNFTVATAIEDARRRADLPEFSTTSVVTTADVLAMAIESAQRLSGIVRTSMGSDYFEVTSDVSTVSGQAYVALPTDCSRLLRASWVVGEDNVKDIQRAERWETNALTTGWSSCVPKYRLRANGINFFPTPRSVETVRLHYDTGIIVTATTDTIAGEVGWREWLALDLCIKFRTAEEKDWQEFALLRTNVEELIRSLSPRDRAGISAVLDVDEYASRRIRPWEY